MSAPVSPATRIIHLLPEEIYNRIAAGEVVERPASVLKELIENSLDAQASHIEAAVSGAGRKEILLTDDGLGMGKEDLLMAFQRHATSKVSSLEDLQAIQTLGFRGEALSAIASVSRVEVTSRSRNNTAGFRLRITGGHIQDLEETGAPPGTIFAVRDLFFNTPARKKFLKSAGVENSHLLNVFKRYALAYPDLRWAMALDGRDIYRLPPEPLESRILALFSSDMAGQIFSVMGEEAGTTLTGYIGSPRLARRSRGDQHLFVNRRWVQHRLLGHAVSSAYGHLLESGCFPFYVLFLSLSPGEVDVNVHPAKTEVKLRRENEIYNFIARIVGETLQQAGTAAMSTMTLGDGQKVDITTGEIVPAAPEPNPSAPPATFRDYPSPADRHSSTRKATGAAYELMFSQRTSENQPSQPVVAVQPETQPAGERTQIYQLHKRYIVTELKSGIAIIDQHAAHERVLYERALKALSGGRLPSQQLLFPRILELEAANAERLREVLDDLQMLGINIREFGEKSFVLEALPSGIQTGLEGDIINGILDELKERGSISRPGSDQVAAAFACRAAIKFGQPLSLAEMNGLIDQLFATKFPFNCPHGRPTLLQLTLSELERRFGRS